MGSWEGSARAARFVDRGEKTAPTLGLKGHRHEDAVHQNELIRAQLSGTNGECQNVRMHAVEEVLKRLGFHTVHSHWRRRRGSTPGPSEQTSPASHASGGQRLRTVHPLLLNRFVFQFAFKRARPARPWIGSHASSQRQRCEGWPSVTFGAIAD